MIAKSRPIGLIGGALILLFQHAGHCSAADYLEMGKSFGLANAPSLQQGAEESVPGYEGTDFEEADYYRNGDTAALESDAEASLAAGESAAGSLVWEQALQPKEEFLSQRTCTATRDNEDHLCLEELTVAVTPGQRCESDEGRDSFDVEIKGKIIASPEVIGVATCAGPGVMFQARRPPYAPSLYGIYNPALDSYTIIRGKEEHVSVQCAGTECTVTLRDEAWTCSQCKNTEDIVLTVKLQTPDVVVDTWSSQCDAYADAGSGCALANSVCTDSQDREIEGVAVSRDCWTYEHTYTCPGDTYTPQPLCAEIEASGCVFKEEACTSQTCTRTYGCQSRLLETARALQDATTLSDIGMDITTNGCRIVKVETIPAIYETDRCMAWRDYEDQGCRQELQVSISPWCVPGTVLASANKTYTKNRTAGTDERWKAHVEATCAANGSVSLSGYRQYRRNTDGHSDGWRLIWTEYYSGSLDYNGTLVSEEYDSTQLSRSVNCDADGNCTFAIDAKGDRLATITFGPVAPPVVTTSTTDDCGTYSGDSDCALLTEATCVDSDSPRDFDGLEVSEPCWAWEYTYRCLDATYTDEPYCQTLRDKGCVQQGGQCDGDACQYDFECVVSPAVYEDREDCSERTVSLGDLTFDTQYEGSQGLEEAAATLEAVQEAAQQMDLSGGNCVENPPGSGTVECTGEISIFGGEAKQCSKDRLNFKDCCAQDGWGGDDLAACDVESQTLAYARKGHLCHFVGEYCAERQAKACVRYKKTYCCFASQLGRIVHEQGRPQIGLEWGTSRQPVCRGFTQEELQSLDFGAMDLSEVFSEITDSMPSAEEMQDVIESRIQFQ